MKSGHTQSCGCYQKYKASIANKRFNTFIEENDYYKCIVSDGSYFLIDKEDKEKVEKYCWRKDGNGYVITTINGKNVYLHNMIIDMPPKMLIDHRNHIVYDYRKFNLRIVSQNKNQMNAKLRANNTSGTTGVYWSKQRMKWISQLKINGTNINLGGFTKYEEACKARERAEEKYFGKYSYKNSLKVED